MDAGSQDAGQFWSLFGRDPRVSDNQGLRAADRDRDVVRDAISEAYADGRLSREEMDTRLTQVQEAKLLGDLLPIVADLMPSRDPAPRQSLAHAGPSEIDRLALARYREQRRRALAGMLVPSLICLTIWVWSMISTGGLAFPWPLFVIIGTGGYLARLLIGRESAIEEERERLRKKQARQLIIEQGTGRAVPDDTDVAISAPPERPEYDLGLVTEDERPGHTDPHRSRDHWR